MSQDPYDLLFQTLDASTSDKTGAREAYHPSDAVWSISDAAKVKDWYKQVFGRDLPVTVEGQSKTHNKMGLDHSNSLDVSVRDMNTAEVAAFGRYLKSQKIPYLYYDRAVAGAATAPHYHIGFPSHGIGREPERDSYDQLFDALDNSPSSEDVQRQAEVDIANLNKQAEPLLRGTRVRRPARPAPVDYNAMVMGDSRKLAEQADTLIREGAERTTASPRFTFVRPDKNADFQQKLYQTEKGVNELPNRMTEFMRNAATPGNVERMAAQPDPDHELRARIRRQVVSERAGQIPLRGGVTLSTPVDEEVEDRLRRMQQGQAEVKRVNALMTPADREVQKSIHDQLTNDPHLLRAVDNALDSFGATTIQEIAGAADFSDKILPVSRLLAHKAGLPQNFVADWLRRRALAIDQGAQQAEAEGNYSTTEKGVGFVTRTAADLFKMALLGEGLGMMGVPGRLIAPATFGILSATQAQGANLSPEDVALETAKGTGEGFLFSAAENIPGLQGGRTVAGRLAQTAGRVGTVGAGTYAIEKTLGSGEEQARRAAVSNAAFAGVPSVLHEAVRGVGEASERSALRSRENELAQAAESHFRALSPEANKDADAINRVHDDPEGNQLLTKIVEGAPDVETVKRFRAKAAEEGVSKETTDQLIRQSLKERRAEQGISTAPEGTRVAPVVPSDHLAQTQSEAGNLNKEGRQLRMIALVGDIPRTLRNAFLEALYDEGDTNIKRAGLSHLVSADKAETIANLLAWYEQQTATASPPALPTERRTQERTATTDLEYAQATMESIGGTVKPEGKGYRITLGDTSVTTPDVVSTVQKAREFATRREIMERAFPAQPANPEVLPATTQVPARSVNRSTKPLWEMSLAELEAAHKEAKAADQQTVTSIFGVEGAKEYEKLYRELHHPWTSNAEGDAIQAKIDQIESKLTDAQRAELFKDSPIDELGAYRDSLEAIAASSHSEEAMANAIANPLTDIGAKRDPQTMSPHEQRAYAQLRYAAQIAREQGWDTSRLMALAVDKARSRYSNSEDAAFMLKHLFTPTEGGDARVPLGRLTEGDVSRVPQTPATAQASPSSEAISPQAGPQSPFTETERQALKAEAEALKPKIYTKEGKLRGRVNPKDKARWGELKELSDKWYAHLKTKREFEKNRTYNEGLPAEQAKLEQAQKLDWKKGDEFLVTNTLLPDSPPAKVKIEGFTIERGAGGQPVAVLKGEHTRTDSGQRVDLTLRADELEGLDPKGHYRFERVGGAARRAAVLNSAGAQQHPELAEVLADVVAEPDYKPTPKGIGNPALPPEQMSRRGDVSDPSFDVGRGEAPTPESPLGGAVGMAGGAPTGLGDLLTRVKDNIKARFKTSTADTNYSGVGAGMDFWNRNLAQLEKADTESTTAMRRSAGWKAQASAIMSAAWPKVNEALKGTGLSLDAFRAILAESRLRGIRARWREMAARIKVAPDAEVKESYDTWLGDLIDNLEHKSAFKDEQEFIGSMKEWTDKMREAEDYDSLRQYLSEQFNHAADQVAQIAIPGGASAFDRFISDPKFQRPLRMYKDLIESKMADIHARNEGVFSNALGPLDTYFPLSPMDAKGELLRSKGTPVRGLNAVKPRNPSNQFATGLGEYDLTAKAFRTKLETSLRSNNKASSIDTMEQAGLIRKLTTRTTPETIDLHGRTFKAKEIVASRERTIFKDGKPINLPAVRYLFPEWLAKAYEVIYPGNGRAPEPGRIRYYMNIVNKFALQGPLDFVFHNTNLASVLVASSPYIPAKVGAGPIGKAATALGNTPLTKVFTAIKRVLDVEPISGTTLKAENIKRLQELAELGVIPDRYGSETYSREYANITGAELKRFSLGPMLYGPKGFDIRARLVMDKIFTDLFPHATTEERFQWNNQMPNYVRGLQGKFERLVKDSGFAPFYTAGSTIYKTGVKTTLGIVPIPKSVTTPAQRVKFHALQQMTAGAIGMASAWAITNYAVNGEWPWDDKKSRLMQIRIPERYRKTPIVTALYGDDTSRDAYLDMSFFNPALSRALKAGGIPKAYDVWQAGGSGSQMFEHAQVQAANTALHPVTSGPLFRAPFVFTTGSEPYMTGPRKDGRWNPTANFYPVVNGTESGLESFAARTSASVLGVNNFYEDMAQNLGEYTGFNVPGHVKERDPGWRWLKMGVGLFTPRLIGRPYSQNMMRVRLIREHVETMQNVIKAKAKNR